MKKLLKKLYTRLFIKKIGEGWDYIVFKNPAFPEKVIKVMRPYPKQVWSRFLYFPRLFILLANKNARRDHMLKTKESLRPFLTTYSHLFGNPRFIGTSYIQDKAVTMRAFLKSHPEKREEIFIKFFQLLELCWELGFSDKYFKYSTFGVNQAEEIMIIDLSELTFSKPEIEKIIRTKRWKYSLDSVALGKIRKQATEHLSYT